MTLQEASLQMTEQEYRDIPCISFSLLQKYDREGFATLFQPDEEYFTPSLLFGSAVDCMITEGPEVFTRKFLVSDIPKISDTMQSIADQLVDICARDTMDTVSDAAIVQVANDHSYQTNWKDDTRVQKIREVCSAYYNLRAANKDKTLLTEQVYSDVVRAVEALKTDKHTAHFFIGHDPFGSVERHYQLKFISKPEILGGSIKGMLDLVCVDHANKTIHPCDVKTTKDIYSFEESFYKYRYYLQASIYTWLLAQAIKDDCPELQKYKMMPYKFIVVDRKVFRPVVFEWNVSNDVVDPYGHARRNWLDLFAEVKDAMAHYDRNLPPAWHKEVSDKGFVTLKNYNDVFNKNQG